MPKDFANRNVRRFTDDQLSILKSLVNSSQTFYDVVNTYGLDEVYEVIDIVEETSK